MYCLKQSQLVNSSISHTMLDFRAIEAQHVKSRPDVQKAGNFGVRTGCRLMGHQQGMKHVMLRQLQRVFINKRLTFDARIKLATKSHLQLNIAISIVGKMDDCSVLQASKNFSLVSEQHLKDRKAIGSGGTADGNKGERDIYDL